MTSYIRGVIIDLSLSFSPLDSIKATITELNRHKRLHVSVVLLLIELAGHSAEQVRRCAANLLGVSLYVQDGRGSMP